MVRFVASRARWVPLFVSLSVVAAVFAACGGKAHEGHENSVEGTAGSGGVSASGGADASGAGGAPSEVGYRCQGTEQRIERGHVCDGIDDCPLGDDEPCTKPVPACPK